MDIIVVRIRSFAIATQHFATADYVFARMLFGAHFLTFDHHSHI